MKYALSSRLPGKRAFITGAGSGLGKALALELAGDGWSLGLSDIDPEGLAKTVATANQLGGKTFSYELDVSDKVAYAEVAKRFEEEAGGLELLINNAGVGDGGDLGTVSLENWEWLLGINQMGVLYGTHYFLPLLRKSPQSHILNIASAAAFVSPSSMGPYNMSKAAVRSFSETLYAELGPEGIEVSVVMPTFFKTNIMQHSRTGGEEKEVGEMMMAVSGLEADKVAQYILKKAGKKRPYIILPAQARWLWRLKRWMPNLFLKIVRKTRKDKEKFRKRLEKRYQKLKAKEPK